MSKLIELLENTSSRQRPQITATTSQFDLRSVPPGSMTASMNSAIQSEYTDHAETARSLVKTLKYYASPRFPPYFNSKRNTNPGTANRSSGPWPIFVASWQGVCVVGDLSWKALRGSGGSARHRRCIDESGGRFVRRNLNLSMWTFASVQ